MRSADGRYVLSYNGEIYNYRELRAELRDLGAIFRTDGDSEVILAAWARWGEDCVSRLHGMFAFAIWDSVRDSTHGVRSTWPCSRAAAAWMLQAALDATRPRPARGRGRARGRAARRRWGRRRAARGWARSRRD